MRLFQKGEWNILWPFYTSEIIYGLLIIFAPYVIIYFLDIGLSFFQISILMVIMRITPFIFEIPTGALADIYGRKPVVILGWMLSGVFTTLIFFTDNFYLLAFLIFLISFSFTLSSGADQAWVVDLLGYNKKRKLIHDYYIKVSSISSLTVIFMGIISALFVKHFGLRPIWIISGIGTIISSLILLKAKEYFKKERISLTQTFKKTLSNSGNSLKYTLKNRNLLFLSLALLFILFSFSMNNNMWQPFLKDLGLNPYLLGYVYSLIGVFTLGVPFLSKPLLKKIKKEKYYLIIYPLAVFLLLLSIYYTNVIAIAVIILVLISIFDQLDRPVYDMFFQKLIPSKIRATTTSLKSMVMGIGGAVGILIGGIVADKVGAQMTIFYSAFLLVPAIISYLLIKQK